MLGAYVVMDSDAPSADAKIAQGAVGEAPGGSVDNPAARRTTNSIAIEDAKVAAYTVVHETTGHTNIGTETVGAQVRP